MLMLCYPKCSTCQKAQKWLDAHQISYEVRNIREFPPTEEEIRKWYSASGLPLKRFFNTSGIRYRELGLKDKLPGMNEKEQIELLSSDGMLVKRPILVLEDNSVLVGFREKTWQEILEKEI